MHLLTRSVGFRRWLSPRHQLQSVMPESLTPTNPSTFERRRRFSVLAGASPFDRSYQWSQFITATPMLQSSWGIPPLIVHHRQSPMIQYQQVRFRRHDRASSKPRPMTKKQRQAYNRRMKRINDEQAKHSAPGSKAGARRQWAKERWQQLLAASSADGESSLALPQQEENEEYTYDDAIVEELMGNSSHLTSQPTPEPIYLGHKHRTFYNRVADQMDLYKVAIESQKQQQSPNNEAIPIDPTSVLANLPSDKDISNVLRAYRDRNGTRRQPIGVAMALQHLLSDLGVPLHAFGEYTYTSLLTCCRTPKEARRIFQLMRDQNSEISSYSWSILVDIHAKLGDFEGCGLVLKEMATHGYAPTLAAYTSLLAACYKVCNDAGQIPHAVRARAGAFGWEKWQEIRIVGLEPDVMAYGAILRLCAARGQPERAIGLLEDMERFEVKPTTLCFTAALRAVAKSHETAIRFENGWSRRNLRRESIAAHHGNMARQIVILAESAEVDQDDGFVSALMLCAAAAGDSATAKAVLLASEVRRMDQLRTIGSKDVFLNSGDGSRQENRDIVPLALGHVEESTTTQVAEVAPNDGRVAVINQSFRDVNVPTVQTFGEREYGTDTRVVSALIRASAQAMGKNGIGTIWAGRDNGGYLCENSLRLITKRWEPSYRDTSIPGVNTTKVGIGALRHVDQRDIEEERMPGKRRKFRGLYVEEEELPSIDDMADPNQFLRDNDDTLWDSNGEDDSFSATKNYFDKESEPPFQAAAVDTSESDPTETESQIESIDEDDVSSLFAESEIFEKFLSELKAEASRNGEDFDLTDDEARGFFELMKEEYSEGLEYKSDSFETVEDAHVDDDDNEELIDVTQFDSNPRGSDNEEVQNITKQNRKDAPRAGDVVAATVTTADATMLNIEVDPARLAKIQDIQEALPGLPLNRVKKVVRAFESTLSNPSMLNLVPILRENMPDHLTSKWLRIKNNANAEIAWRKACEDRVVDSALLSTMLQVKTTFGNFEQALDFHAQEFENHGMTPSAYSDRLVFQMLVSNNQIPRALKFKQSIENHGRKLDLASYGTLIQYFSRRSQLGSSLMVLKECLQTHNAPPSESFLAPLRILHKQEGISHTDKVALKDMIGGDPIEWLKHGERYLKREKSKKGRRDIQYAQNRLLS